MPSVRQDFASALRFLLLPHSSHLLERVLRSVSHNVRFVMIAEYGDDSKNCEKLCACSIWISKNWHTGAPVSENWVKRKPALIRPCTTSTTTTARFCIVIQGVDNPDQAPLRPAQGTQKRAQYSPT
jgi:hypothetical protein